MNLLEIKKKYWYCETVNIKFHFKICFKINKGYLTAYYYEYYFLEVLILIGFRISTFVLVYVAYFQAAVLTIDGHLVR